MRRLRRFTALAAAALLLTVSFMSCNNLSENELGLEKEGNGTVVFKITDAPFPADLVEEANVTIDWIKLLKYPAEEPEEEASEADVFLVELEEAATVNLLELRNGLTESLAELEVPAGSYAEIRLHVVDADILLKDGTVYDLKVPSGAASGLKIKLNPSLDVEEGVYAEVLFDFDLSRSFVMRGNAKNLNGFIFKPVVRAVANVQTAAGEITGVVADQDGNPVGNADLILLQNTDTISSAITSVEEGYYSFIGILPGDYTLVLTVGETVQEVAITVEAGLATVQNFVVGTVTETDGSGDAGTGDTGTGDTGTGDTGTGDTGTGDTGTGDTGTGDTGTGDTGTGDTGTGDTGTGDTGTGDTGTGDTGTGDTGTGDTGTGDTGTGDTGTGDTGTGDTTTGGTTN